MKKKVFVKEQNGNEVEGWLEIEESHIELALVYNDKRISKTAEDYFSALCLIRRELEEEGIVLICNGASKDVFPSPMMRDMGDGDQAYRLKIGSPARMSDVVNIFDLDKDAFIVSTVDEQEMYYKEWLDSKKNASY